MKQQTIKHIKGSKNIKRTLCLYYEVHVPTYIYVVLIRMLKITVEVRHED